jgi:hypothetical protein
VFQAAGVLSDGTVVGHAESRGASQRRASLRVATDGRWSSVVESGPVTTEAHGRLRAPDQPITLRRTRSRAGEPLWTADAVTEFDVVADDGTPIARRTTGTIGYPGGATGTFRTDYLSASSDGSFRDSSGAWQPVPGLGTGQTGSQTTEVLPGGPGNVEWDGRLPGDRREGA